MLVSLSQNKLRIETYEVMIEHFQLGVKRRSLQKNLKRFMNQGQRYKAAYSEKHFTGTNRGKRVIFGGIHEHDIMEGFWKYIVHTDEMHMDPASMRKGEILREAGTRYKSENIVEYPSLEGNKIHCGVWVSFEEKAEKLEFYYDEEEYTDKPIPTPKPRRRPRIESPEDYEERLCIWESEKPYPKDVKPQGNVMIQKYYVKRLLPVYIKAIERL
ncbi:hypothetical protein EAE96_010908 [Botrytis aclada]|nr:hypothetical protein EAE96_010908 [Botrytis aclada]